MAEVEREAMEYDVVIVGAGPANPVAAAWARARLLTTACPQCGPSSTRCRERWRVMAARTWSA